MRRGATASWGTPLMITFRDLAGVPVHYDRYPKESGFGYGTRGKPLPFKGEGAFIEALDRAMTEVLAAVPASFGAAEVITSAGAYVSKPGYHGLGRAFDLDGIFFAGKEFVTLNFPSDMQFYIGVEAVLRKHFGTILNYDYDLAHRDHFHIDNGSSVGWNKVSKSRVCFLQNALNQCFGAGIQVDGAYGPETEKALKLTLEDLGIGTIGVPANWLTFLDRTAAAAFKLA